MSDGFASLSKSLRRRDGRVLFRGTSDTVVVLKNGSVSSVTSSSLPFNAGTRANFAVDSELRKNAGRIDLIPYLRSSRPKVLQKWLYDYTVNTLANLVNAFDGGHVDVEDATGEDSQTEQDNSLVYPQPVRDVLKDVQVELKARKDQGSELRLSSFDPKDAYFEQLRQNTFDDDESRFVMLAAEASPKPTFIGTLAFSNGFLLSDIYHGMVDRIKDGTIRIINRNGAPIVDQDNISYPDFIDYSSPDDEKRAATIERFSMMGGDDYLRQAREAEHAHEHQSADPLADYESGRTQQAVSDYLNGGGVSQQTSGNGPTTTPSVEVRTVYVHDPTVPTDVSAPEGSEVIDLSTDDQQTASEPATHEPLLMDDSAIESMDAPDVDDNPSIGEAIEPNVSTTVEETKPEEPSTVDADGKANEQEENDMLGFGNGTETAVQNNIDEASPVDDQSQTSDSYGLDEANPDVSEAAHTVNSIADAAFVDDDDEARSVMDPSLDEAVDSNDTDNGLSADTGSAGSEPAPAANDTAAAPDAADVEGPVSDVDVPDTAPKDTVGAAEQVGPGPIEEASMKPDVTQTEPEEAPAGAEPDEDVAAMIEAVARIKASLASMKDARDAVQKKLDFIGDNTVPSVAASISSVSDELADIERRQSELNEQRAKANKDLEDLKVLRAEVERKPEYEQRKETLNERISRLNSALQQ